MKNYFLRQFLILSLVVLGETHHVLVYLELPIGFFSCGETVESSHAVKRDSCYSRGGAIIWSGNRGMAGSAWMVILDFSQQFNLRSFDWIGKALSKRLPIPQNLTAKKSYQPT